MAGIRRTGQSSQNRIDPKAWREFWEARPGAREGALWLPDLAAMKPETRVSPASLLRLKLRPPRPEPMDGCEKRRAFIVPMRYSGELVLVRQFMYPS
ncbi:MAG: hypothetical protein LBU45_03980 [Azoarcus sp.]|nr:hypothetical protein [Azoarcus sp.]